MSQRESTFSIARVYRSGGKTSGLLAKRGGGRFEGKGE